MQIAKIVSNFVFTRTKIKILLFHENANDEKNFAQAAANLFFLTNLIEFFKQPLHFKNYSNSTFICWKTKSSTFYGSQRKNFNSSK